MSICQTCLSLSLCRSPSLRGEMSRWGNVHERPLPAEPYSRVGHQSCAAINSFLLSHTLLYAGLLPVLNNSILMRKRHHLDIVGPFICSIQSFYHRLFNMVPHI